MQIGIITSVETRHRFFVNAVKSALPVVAVAYEKTGYSPAEHDLLQLSPEEAKAYRRHFAERTRQEEVFFGHEAELLEGCDDCRVLHLQPGSLNSENTLQFFVDAGVEAIAVYGSNLVKDPLLSHFGQRMLNLHLGLSPYYRGTATNFYPLLNEEPEYIGATIHLIDAGIDSGPIVRHARPEIEPEDGPHTIGCKAILAGIEAMIEAMRQLAAGKLKAVRQWDVPDAKIYKRKDYHPRQVLELYRKLDDGLIPKYVGRAQEASAKLRLIS